MILLPYVAGRAAGVGGAALELGVGLGLALAAVVKWGLARVQPGVFGKTAPQRGRHRGTSRKHQPQT